MDIRHYDPAEAVDVTEALGESNPQENRLYRVGTAVYKAKAFWLSDQALLAGQRTAQVTVSLCDAQGQAQRDGAGALIVSEPHQVVITAGLEASAADQIDEGRRRWVVAFHHINSFWDLDVPGVASPAVAAAEAAADLA